MSYGVSAVGVGFQPKQNYTPGMQLVFILYMMFGSMFITNLFIEVVINTFRKERSKIDRNYMLSNFQTEWVYL